MQNKSNLYEEYIKKFDMLKQGESVLTPEAYIAMTANLLKEYNRDYAKNDGAEGIEADKQVEALGTRGDKELKELKLERKRINAELKLQGDKLDYETESMRKYINTPMWNAKNNRWMVKHYLASCIPPERNLQGIRKAFVETAEYDALHDEGIIIASELKALGTDTALSETEGTLHGYDFLWKKPYVRKMISRRIEWLEER